jgi:beta-1,4-mannosyltransferase
LLAETLAQLRQSPRAAAPDLSRRDWDAIGQQHYCTYLEAMGRDSEAYA